jgi:hypothetical protein
MIVLVSVKPQVKSVGLFSLYALKLTGTYAAKMQSERGTIVGKGLAEVGPESKMMTISDFIAQLANVTNSVSEARASRGHY